jgi:hypothetical protein
LKFLHRIGLSVHRPQCIFQRIYPFRTRQGPISITFNADSDAYLKTWSCSHLVRTLPTHSNNCTNHSNITLTHNHHSSKQGRQHTHACNTSVHVCFVCTPVVVLVLLSCAWSTHHVSHPRHHTTHEQRDKESCRPVGYTAGAPSIDVLDWCVVVSPVCVWLVRARIRYYQARSA